MTRVPEDPTQRPEYIRQQLQHAANWQFVGFRVYTVLLILLMSSGFLYLCGTFFIPTMHEAGHGKISYDSLPGKILFVCLCTIIAAPFVGTLIGLPIARRRLRRLISELLQAGENPQSIELTIRDLDNKNIKDAARVGLHLLASEGSSLSASATLMRAATKPATTQSGVLLRPADGIAASPDSTEQLLRASASKDTTTNA